MTIKGCSLLLFLLSQITIFAQKPSKFDTIYREAYLETAQKDAGKALKIADSLYRITNIPIYQVKSLMLSATIYQQAGDLKQSIQFAEKAEKLVKKINDYNWQTRVWGFLATQYRIARLYKKSKVYSENALNAAKQIKDPEAANAAMGLMYQELAYYETENKNYKESIQNIISSQEHFNLIHTDKDALMGNNEQLLGLNYYYLKAYDTSIAHYRNGLRLLESQSSNPNLCLVYNGLAAVYIEQNDLKKGAEYIKKALNIANNSTYLELKSQVYDVAMLFYAKTKDIKSLDTIKQVRDSITEILQEKRSFFFDDNFTELEKDNSSLREKSVFNFIIIIIGILVIIAGSVIFTFYTGRQKLRMKKFKNIIRQLEERKLVTIPQSGTNINTAEEHGTHKENNIYESDTRPLMNMETEHKILYGLEQFETSTEFINKNMSLSYLASYLNTNTKYLSHIINTYKKKDFYNYINELRINYVIDKLNTEQLWRTYKISTLADEAGFSSHSKFATIFKLYTGIPPSSFIKYLDNSNQVK